MKIFKKNTVVLLMAVSQLLLTLFVIYWLIGQFKAEKHSLYKELHRGFIASERIMMDSLLAKHLIDPILNDSTKKMRVIDIQNDDSVIMNDTAIIHLRNNPDTNQSIFYQGVGMFVKRIEGMGIRHRGARASFLSSRADTSILKKSFSDYLIQNEFDFSYKWVTGEDSILTYSKGMTLRTRAFNRSVAVIIGVYNFYFFKVLIPQILFAIVLLLVTLGSFRISYLNIRKQKRLLTIKNEFISNITHELKTPVATVKVALEALLDFDMKRDPVKVKDYLEMSLLELDRLELLVSKVLNNSVLENGVNLFSMVEGDLNLIIVDVLNSQQHRLNKNGLSINFQTDLKESLVMVDKVHLQGVFLNLIDNSIKYGGKNTKIELILQQNKSDYIISIKDNGPGIPKEYLDKVFDKFFRVPTHDKHNVKGYGLGLNYAQLVIQHHQGNIKVENIEEGGCEFILTIPKLHHEA